MATRINRVKCHRCARVALPQHIRVHWTKIKNGRWVCKACVEGENPAASRRPAAVTHTDDTVGILYDWNGLRFGNDVYYPPRLDVLPGWVRFRYWSS